MIERSWVRIPAGTAGEISSLDYIFVVTLIRCPLHRRFTSVASRASRSFCQEETYEINELTRNSSGNVRPQSSQLAKPVRADPGLK